MTKHQITRIHFGQAAILATLLLVVVTSTGCGFVAAAVEATGSVSSEAISDKVSGTTRPKDLAQMPAATPTPGPTAYPGLANALPRSLTVDQILDVAEALTIQVYEKASPSVVHITSHSVVKTGNDTSSRILLAGGDGQDGNLTVDEVLYSDMDVNLVTLSADRTALIWSGSGGFPGAFLLAGADSVLAPVWTIDRGVTAVFMEFFYGNLTDHDKAEALRLAQQMVIDSEVEKGYRRLAHPGYWAPFILYGSYK